MRFKYFQIHFLICKFIYLILQIIKLFKLEILKKIKIENLIFINPNKNNKIKI